MASSSARPMRGSLHADDFRVLLYDELCYYDAEGTGEVSAEEFTAALRAAGMVLGTAEADKLMTQVQILDNGRIDFFRWAEDMESHLNAKISRGHLSRGARETDGNAEAQERYKEVALKQRDHILGQKDKIYRAFCHFEANGISEKDFVDFLHNCGVDDTQELNSLLRRKATTGYVQFAELMRVCLLPGKNLTPTSSVRNNEAIVWDCQSRSTDVVSWRGHPPPARTGRKLHTNQTRFEPTSELTTNRGDINDKNLSDVGRIKQERLYAAVRDFAGQITTASAFRSILHDMGMSVGRDLDMLISRHSSEGSVTFSQFIRAMNMQPGYKLEMVVDTAGTSSAERTHGDLISWSREGDATEKTSSRRHIPAPHDNGNIVQWGAENRSNNTSQVGSTTTSTANNSYNNHYDSVNKANNGSTNDYRVEGESGSSAVGGSGRGGGSASGYRPSKKVVHVPSHQNLISWDEEAAARPPPQSPPRRQLSSAQGNHGDIFGWSKTSQVTPPAADRTLKRRVDNGSGRRDHDIISMPEAPPAPVVKDWRNQSLSTRPW